MWSLIKVMNHLVLEILVTCEGCKISICTRTNGPVSWGYDGKWALWCFDNSQLFHWYKERLILNNKGNNFCQIRKTKVL